MYKQQATTTREDGNKQGRQQVGHKPVKQDGVSATET